LRRIATILSAYDELIEKNKRSIQILEEMAQALYREWFIHFRFLGHEQTKRISPSRRDIPHGWEMKKLCDLITCKRSATKPGSHLQERR
jgi:type I restriction enzyme S subunit